MFDKFFFTERQEVLLRALNHPLGGWAMRRGMWIPDRRNEIVKVTPESVHVLLPDGRICATIYSNKQFAQALNRNYKPLWEVLHWWDMRIANRLFPAWNAGLDTYSSQPDGTGGLDNYIVSDVATTNLGTSATLSCGESNTGASTRRILIKFDFSSITAPVLVGNAALSLWQFSEESSNARDFKIYRQKRDWVETQSTWNIWKTSNNWSTAGGFHSDDCEQTAICSLNLGSAEGAGEKQWREWTLTSLDDMISGAWTNNGFMIKADTESNDAQFFRSSDYGTAGERPRMLMFYAPLVGISKLNGSSFLSARKVNGVSVTPISKVNGVSRPVPMPSVANPQTSSIGSGTSVTEAGYTPAAGNSRVVVAALALNPVGSGAHGFSFTFGGVAMTLLDSHGVIGGASIVVYYIKEADFPSTPADVVASWTNSNGAVLSVFTISNVDQTTPFDTVAKAAATSGTPSVGVSSADGDLVVDAVAMISLTTDSFVVGANQIIITSLHNGTGELVRGASSCEDGGSSITMSWTNTSSFSWAIMGWSVNPA